MKSKINPKLGLSDAALRSQIRSALRKVWRLSSRRKFLEKVRVPHEGPGRGRYDVICAKCDKRMGFSEKITPTNADGTKRKRPTLAYQVDHLHGNPPFLDIEKDLGAYANSLIFGEMRVVCYECHQEITRNQRKSKN